jgi:site-specific DNA-adenine methylase
LNSKTLAFNKPAAINSNMWFEVIKRDLAEFVNVVKSDTSESIKSVSKSTEDHRAYPDSLLSATIYTDSISVTELAFYDEFEKGFDVSGRTLEISKVTIG